MKELRFWINWISKRKKNLSKEEYDIITKAIEITKKLFDSENGMEVWAIINDVQHYFVPEQVGQWIEVEYEGNLSLCRRVSVKHDNGRYKKTSEIDAVKLNNKKKVCPRCLEVYNERKKK